MNKYKLLTPGPLTTTETVKEAMLTDHCTWDDDYKTITQNIRKRLLTLAGLVRKHTRLYCCKAVVRTVLSLFLQALSEKVRCFL